jgi:hypothetical protein
MIWGGSPKMHPRLGKLQERIDRGGGKVGMPALIELANALDEVLTRLERIEGLLPPIEAYMVQETRTNEIASVESVLNLARRLQKVEAEVSRNRRTVG